MDNLILIPSRVFEKEYFGIRANYFDYFSNYGNVLAVPLWEEEQYTDLIKQAKMVVYPGGADINPQRYGIVPSLKTQNSDPVQEYFDDYFLPQVINMNVPIFGICRGLQAINVFFGGTLDQDISYYHPRSEDWTDLVHKVDISYPVGGLTKTTNLDVNSLHHQCIELLGDGLEVIATAEDGTIEGIAHRDSKIVAVQWHPEALPRNMVIDFWIDKILGK